VSRPGRPPDHYGALAELLGDLAARHAPLGGRTTYRVGGAAAVLVEAGSEADLARVHEAVAALGRPVPVLLLGQKAPSPNRRGSFLLRDRVPGEVLEHPNQPRMVPAFAAERGGGVEELLSRRRIRQ